MPMTYRCMIDTNAVRNRFLLLPGFKLERVRDSKRLCAEAVEEMLRLLAQAVPYNGASARLERTDSRGYTTQIARFSGRCTATDFTSGAAKGGVWMLEEWHDAGADSAQDGLPDFVRVGRQS